MQHTDLQNSQVACVPQTPGHGSTHFWLTHALSVGHSGFMKHSGLHSMYGFPNKPGKHVHEAAPLCSLHSAFIPHGDGRYGSMISGLGLVVVGLMLLENGSPTYPWLQTHMGT